jgi:membrane protein DedA with SNARE-associated domain
MIERKKGTVVQRSMRSLALLTASGTAIWNTVLVFLGKFAGDAWRIIVNYVHVYALIALLILALLAAVVGVIFIKKRFLSPRGTAGEDDTGPTV